MLVCGIMLKGGGEEEEEGRGANGGEGSKWRGK